MRREQIRAFLEEDGVGWRDITSGLVAGESVEATVITRDAGVAAGLGPAQLTFEELDVEVTNHVSDGEACDAGDELLTASGDAQALLAAERVALNLLGSMSGIATATRRCVERVEGAGETETRIAGTRKTTPGYRSFEKRAITLGGGDPHRYDLSDAVLIKENHIAVMGLEAAIETAQQRASFTTKIDVEAETESEAVAAADAGADIVLLDNMSPAEVEGCVGALAESDVLVEASGNLTVETVAAYAAAGADILSMGSLTHSAQWLDVSMQVE